MKPSASKPPRPAWIAAVALAASGCAASAADPPAPTARVIVRFEPGTPDPSARSFLDALAARARVARLDMIRPMSGDAWVLQVSCTTADDTGSGDACAAALARLRASRPVVGVEIDQRVTHQSTPHGPRSLEEPK